MPEPSQTLAQASASVSQALQLEEQKARKLAQWISQSEEALNALASQREQLLAQCEDLAKQKARLSDELDAARKAHVESCRVHLDALERRASQLDAQTTLAETRLRDAHVKEGQAQAAMGKFLEAKATVLESFQKAVTQLQNAVDQLDS